MAIRKNRVDLTFDSQTLVVITVNGRLVAEVAVGEVTSRDSLEAEVGYARASRVGLAAMRQALAAFADAAEKPDHATPPAKRRGEFCEGLADGLAGETRPYPTDPSLPQIQPRYNSSYSRGYRLGETIRATVAVTAEAEPW